MDELWVMNMCPAMSVVHRVGIAKAERRVNPDGLAPRRMVSSWGRSGLYTQPTISAATMGRSAEARLVRHHSHTRRAMLRWWTWKEVSGSVGIGLQNSGRCCVKKIELFNQICSIARRKSNVSSYRSDTRQINPLATGNYTIHCSGLCDLTWYFHSFN